MLASDSLHHPGTSSSDQLIQVGWLESEEDYECESYESEEEASEEFLEAIEENPKRIRLDVSSPQVNDAECSICFEELDDSVTICSCNSRFCQGCLKEYIHHQIKRQGLKSIQISSLKQIRCNVWELEMSNGFAIKCPSKNCPSSIWSNRLSPNICSWLSPLCRECYSFSGGAKKDDFFCGNCRKNICRDCRKDHPSQVTCNDYSAWLLDNFEAEDRIRIWASNNELVKHCPKCSNLIEKNGGCSHMMCTKCQTSFNWEDAKRFHITPIRKLRNTLVSNRSWRRGQRLRRRGMVVFRKS